nr:hypothetical protein [Tanacetum cinerariifolium]
TAPIPLVTQPDTTPIRQYSRRARIAQSSALPNVSDEPASLVGDVNKGEACPTESGFIADQDRATIAKISTLPYDLAPRVTSPNADEGSMQQNISELTALCTSLQRQHSELLAKFQAQEVEILGLKERVQVLEDREGVAAKHSEDDAPIKGRRGIDVPTGSGFIPTAGPLLLSFPLAVKEQEEHQEKEDMMMTEQIARDAEVARIHAEEELQGMIDSLDKSNENIAKYLQEYQEFASELRLEKRIELISDLVKYQDNYSKVEDFIPMGLKEENERLKRKGLNLEQEQVKKQKSSEEAPEMEKPTEEITEEKMKELMQLVPVKDVYVQALQVEHPIIDWKVHTEGQRSYWQIIMLGGSSACYQFFVDLLKQLDWEDLNQLWALVKEYLSIKPATSKKEMELWVELKRMYEPDPEDQLWTVTQNFMHAPVEWKLYDLSGVHHLTAKDKKIFMLVEKDCPLKKGLALVMISYKLQVKNYSQMAEDLIRKTYNIANTLRRIEMPLPEVCTAIEEKRKKLPVKDR